MMTTSNEHNNAPAVPQGIPVQEVIDAIEAWKSAWLKVPPFADRVNKATREAITISHNSLFLLLQSAQQAQRMPDGCPTPTGCGPHGCHGACIAATPAPAPAQERCHLCDCTGDIHDATGEWRGECPYCKPAQEVTQSEPIYQLQRGDGSWIDQDKASYDYNAQYGINTIRIVYTAPAPAVPQGWAFSVSDDDDGTWLRVKSPGGREAAFSAVNGGLAHDNRRSIASRVLLELKEALAATPAPAPAQEAIACGLCQGAGVLSPTQKCICQYGGKEPAQEEVGLILSAEDVHTAFTKNFPKTRISQAWISFAADIAQAIAARAAKPAQEVILTDEERQQVFRDAENRMVREINLSWRNAVVDEVIAALRAKGGKS